MVARVKQVLSLLQELIENFSFNKNSGVEQKFLLVVILSGFDNSQRLNDRTVVVKTGIQSFEVFIMYAVCSENAMQEIETACSPLLGQLIVNGVVITDVHGASIEACLFYSLTKLY